MPRALAVACAAGLVASIGPAAAADPTPSISTVQKKVRALNTKVDKITEDYDQAKLQLASAKHRVHQLNKRVASQHKKVKKLRTIISAMAVSAYMGGGSDVASLVTAKSPQDFLDRAASLKQLSTQDDRKITKFRRASSVLSSERTAAHTVTKKQHAIKQKLASKKSDIEASLSKQQSLLDRLQAAGRDTSIQASRDNSRSNTPSHLPPASGKAKVAIAFAKAQLGKPYSWGAAGPGSYDCSGLTMAAYAHAGVSLPHSSSAQMGSGPSVPKSQLQPGDLVFFGSPVHHVGLYVGGGMMIHAPHTGDVVRYANINGGWYTSEYAGAVRPS